MKTLIVIDMQDEFIGRHTRVEKNVLSFIREAKTKRHAIFVVSLTHCGSTLSSIIKTTSRYSLAFWVRKSEQDGSVPLYRSIQQAWQQGLVGRINHMSFCGVYTGLCVRDTFLSMCAIAAKGQSVLHRDTKMVLRARGCYDGSSQRKSLNEIREQQVLYPNLRVMMR